MKLTNTLYIFIFFSLLLFPFIPVLAADVCDSCGCAVSGGCCGSGLECRGDSDQTDGINNGRCYEQCPLGATCLNNPITACTFEDLVNNILNFIFYLA